jgi:hypothetical protein
MTCCKAPGFGGGTKNFVSALRLLLGGGVLHAGARLVNRELAPVTFPSAFEGVDESALPHPIAPNELLKIDSIA